MSHQVVRHDPAVQCPHQPPHRALFIDARQERENHVHPALPALASHQTVRLSRAHTRTQKHKLYFPQVQIRQFESRVK